MKLYIFDKSEQLQAVLANEANACPFWDAVHDEKLNGENTFSFSMPADREEAQYVVEGSYVAFQDADGYWQLFEIRQVADTHGDNGIVREVFAEHAYYELIDDILTDVRPTNVSAALALQQALQNSRWVAGTVDDLGTNSTNFYYESALSAAQKVASTWKGELQYRVTISGNQITARYVDLLVRRGAITGKRFEYTKDIKEIKREVDASNVITACYGRGKGEEVDTTADGKTTYGRRTTFANVVWTTPTNPTNKPVGQEWVGDDVALAQWGRNGRHRFGIFLDDNETDPAVLLQKTWDYLQENKTPRITYSLSVLDLERLSDYEHEAVRLGDTVNVIDKAFNPAIELSARVIEIKRNLLLPENTEIVLGNFAPTLADSLTQQQQIISNVRDRQGVWDRATQFNPDGTLDTSWLEGIIDTLQNQVNAGAGTVTITNDNGILITDSATNPTKALRLLGGIFAIANSKNPDGTWNWRTFGTGDGFTADEINAGQIRTSLIKIFGSSQFYWDGDNIYVINPANMQQQIRIGKYDGTNYGIAFTTDGGATWKLAMDFGGLVIADGSITTPKLAAGAVTADKIAAGAITARELSVILSEENLIPDSSGEFNLWYKQGGYGGVSQATDGDYHIFVPDTKYGWHFILCDFGSATTAYCRLKCSINNGIDEEYVRVNGNTQYFFAMDVAFVSYQATKDSRYITQNMTAVLVYDIAENVIQTIPYYVTLQQFVDPATDEVFFEHFETTFTTPSNAHHVRIQVGANISQGTDTKAAIDNIILIEGGLSHVYKPAPNELPYYQPYRIATPILSKEDIVSEQFIQSRLSNSLGYVPSAYSTAEYWMNIANITIDQQYQKVHAVIGFNDMINQDPYYGKISINVYQYSALGNAPIVKVYLYNQSSNVKFEDIAVAISSVDTYGATLQAFIRVHHASCKIRYWLEHTNQDYYGYNLITILEDAPYTSTLPGTAYYATPLGETWQNLSLLNSWVNYGSPYASASFYRDPFGKVMLRGVIKSGTASTIAYLPSGYRPEYRQMFAVVTYNNAFGQVHVLTSGEIAAITYNNTLLSLDGISFRAKI